MQTLQNPCLRIYAYIASGLSLLLLIQTTSANDRYCPRNSDTMIDASADRMITDADGYAKLSGDVQVIQGDNRLRAGNVRYNARKKLLQAKDTVLYTNCGAVSPDWFIAADQITLSQKQAFAKNAWLVFGNMPVVYFPRYRVLFDERRKSGFLIPELSNSNSRGLELGMPYYLNLAPNRDMTLTPHYLSERGLQLNTEYRHLTPAGLSELEGDWIDDSDYDNSRYSYQIKHRYNNGENLRFNLHYQRVSDVDYADDLGTSLYFTHENYLRSHLNLDYVWNGWQFNLFGDTLQTADEDSDERNRPYEIRPGISLAKNFYPARNLTLNIRSNWIQFDYRGNKVQHQVQNRLDELCSDADDCFYDTQRKIDGQRFDNELGLNWSYRRPGFHFSPSAKIRYTEYDLSGQTGADAIWPRKISRTIPSFSLRSGLVFEKNTSGYRHTLEPELFYLNVAHRNQDDIPLFDTGRTEFRFAELFSENRFNSVDRISDANQLTMAVTHRILHQNSGKEMVRASIGKIYYFRNNRVTLPDEEPERRSNSDIAAELLLDLNNKVRWRGTLVWDSHNNETARTVNRISLNAGDNRLINLYHRYRRGDYEQAGINFRIPLGKRWHLLSAWSNDLRNKESLEVLGGIEYQSCCWGLRFIGQRILKDVDGIDTTLKNGDLDYDTTIGVEFNFKGLGSVTTYSEDLLESSIFNYRAQ